MAYAAIAVAVLALIFAVVSFYWQNLRRGQLCGSEPGIFALSYAPPSFLLTMPLTLRNSGAATIVVENLRCWFPDTEQTLPLPWRRCPRAIPPVGNDAAFHSPFVIKGHDAVTNIVEFGCPFPGFTLTDGRHAVRIDVFEAGRGRWEVVANFHLKVKGSALDGTGAYHQLENQADDPIAQERVDRSLRRLLALLEAKLRPDDG